uniref:RNA-directed DNA polymerase n=1 Tax=Strongyloides papillosus TaxID=174720 RepID=A0A0N5BMT4_STREA
MISNEENAGANVRLQIFNMAFASFEHYDEQEDIEQWLEDFKALMKYAEQVTGEEEGKPYRVPDEKRKFKLLQFIKRPILAKLRATMKETDLDTITYEDLCDALKRTYGHHFLQSRVLTSLLDLSKKNVTFSEAMEAVSTQARKLNKDFINKENLKIIIVLMSSNLPQELKDKYLTELCAEDSKLESLTDLDKLVKTETQNKAKYNQEVSILATSKMESHKWRRKGHFNKDDKCTKCNRRGHTNTSCAAKTKIIPIHVLSIVSENKNFDYLLCNSFSTEIEVINVKRSGLFIDLIVIINETEKLMTMEFDTAAQATILSRETAEEYDLKLENTSTLIKGVSGTQIPCLCKCKLKVKKNSEEESYKYIDIYVADIQSNILELPEIRLLELDKLPLNQISKTFQVNNMMETEFKTLFDDKTMGEFPETIDLQFVDNPKWRHVPTRPYPPGITNDCVQIKINEMLNNGIWKKISYCDASSPVKPVIKKLDKVNVENGLVEPDNVRLTADFSLLNTNLKTNVYPIKNISSELAKVGLMINKKNDFIISVFDVKSAYDSLPISMESSLKCGIATHNGIYLPLRLPQGISQAPGIWQEKMDQIIKEVEVECQYVIEDYGSVIIAYYDDVIILSPNSDEHLQVLKIFCTHMQDKNLRFQKEKVKCFVDSVVILGHLISKKGIQPDPKKLEKLKNLPLPKTSSEMKSFIGCLTYQQGFVRNLAEYKSKLEEVTKTKPYTITKQLEEDFERTKEIMMKYCVNNFYNGRDKLILDCDASDTSMGFVLYSVTEGKEMIIALNSKKFTPCETKLAIQVKECLAIYYGVKKFHQFLTGRRFLIRSDHRTLSLIFKEGAGIKKSTNRRIQRIQLELLEYMFDVEYKKGKEIGLVDTISRSEFQELESEIRKSEMLNDVTEIHKISTLQEVKNIVSNIRIQRIQLELLEYMFDVEYKKGKEIGLVDTISRSEYQELESEIRKRKSEMLNDVTEIHKISTLQEVKNIVSNTIMFTKEDLDKAIKDDKEYLQLLNHVKFNSPCPKEFKKVEEFLGLEGEYVTLGERKVIPLKLRAKCLDLIHITHDGENSMLINARKNIFWPRMNSEIKLYCSQCKKCEEFRRAKILPVKKWSQPKTSFQRIHADVGQFLDQYFIVCQDVYSGMAFIDCFDKHGINQITEFFMNIFRSFGFPEELVTDGGKELVQFGNICLQWGIKYTTSPVEHQSSNGQAERLIQTVKSKLLKMNTTKHSLKENLFLIQTIHQSTKKGNRNLSPYDLVFKYSPKTVLELQFNSRNDTTTDDAKDAEVEHCFKIGDMIWFRKNPKGKWSKGKVEELHGSSIVTIKPDLESTYKSNVKLHLDCIKKRFVGTSEATDMEGHVRS